jgi:putative hydrolase
MSEPAPAPIDAPVAAPIDPIDALDRITYLMDRTLAPSQKVAAFNKARGIVSEVGPDQIRELVRTGKLEDLPGIGKSTGAVIAQAVNGQIPDRLVELEQTSVLPTTDAGNEYRSLLKGDCHLHSNWSDGGAEIDVMARAAQGLGHEYIVLTDHSPRLTVAHGLDRERLERQLDVVAELNEKMAPFRILTGIEVDILEDGSLDQNEDLLGRLDLVVASVHSKLKMPREEMTRRIVLAMASPHTDVLGHCTGRKVSKEQVARVLEGRDQPEAEAPDGWDRDANPVRPLSVFDAEIVFAACAKFDKAVEINCRPERQDPPDQLLELALEYGCKISIDTDAHAPGQLEWQIFGCDKAARHEIEPERIINTWDADRLLEWTGSHATV